MVWRGVTESVAPLPNRRREEPDDVEPVSTKPKLATKPGPSAKGAAAKAVPVTPASARTATRAESKPGAVPLGRKAKRRLARGSDAIDARLDLHGMTQAEAHGALLRFLHRASGDGARVVLVITGKGGGASEGRGVLKRQVPLWLGLPEFRACVVGFESAGIGHGGEGAMYVRLRRRTAG